MSQPEAGTPQAPPRASLLGLAIITGLDVLIAPFYVLMGAFSFHDLSRGTGPSLMAPVMVAVAAASVACPVIAWIAHFAGAGRRKVLALAAAPLAAPVLLMLMSAILTPYPSLVITTPQAVK